MKDDILIQYLVNLIDKCEKYDAFLIPGAIGVDGQFIKLHDVYTKLKVISRKEYEEAKKQDVDLLSELGRGNVYRGKTTVFSRFDAQTFLDGLDESMKSIKDEVKTPVKTELPEKSFQLDNEVAETDTITKISEKESVNENNLNDLKECVNANSQKEVFITEVILSAPGGGKSTLLKMYAIAFSYRLLCLIAGDKLKTYFSEDAINRFESISDELEIKEGAIPIFIEARDIKTANDFADFTSIMKKTIDSVFDEDSISDSVLLSEEYKKVIIVDSIEEFIDEESRNSFLYCLEQYEAENEFNIERVIISSRYKEYQEHQFNFGDVLGKKRIEEKVISELFNDFDIITEFAEKWYASIERLHEFREGAKDDSIEAVEIRTNSRVQRDFIEPIKSNPNARVLITNPLELTSMLLISVSDSFLPQDISKMYGRSIELWITWTNAQGFNYNFEDVMSQLAHIAFRMAISDHDRITIDESGLDQLIMDARTDLQRYFKQEWSPEERIEEFKLFLRKSHIFDYSGNTYEFIHRQYQAYLVAYCIKNNLFSRETRKRRRFDYIEEHIKEKDDFWTQIIILISMLDIDLRDEIIENLLDYAADEIEKKVSEITTKKLKDNSLFYLSMLLQLAIVPGINLDTYELNKLYSLMVDNESGWQLIERKKAEITKLLLLNNQKENDLFLQVITEKYVDLVYKKQDKFRDSFATIVFFCLWNCSASEEKITETSKLLFKNFLNTNIVNEIYNSRNSHDITDRKLYKILRGLGRASISDKQDPASDYYMLIAVMEGYAFSGESPYDVAYELSQNYELEKRIIAINILIIASWLLKIKREKSLGYGFEMCRGKEQHFVEFINSGIVNDNELDFCRDYYAAYMDFYSAECTSDFVNMLQNEEVFISCLRRAYSRIETSKAIWDRESGDYCKEIEFLSSFPIEQYGIIVSSESKKNVEATDKLISEITLGIDSSHDCRNKIIGTKMLAMIYSQEKDMNMYNDELERLVENSEHELREADLEHWAKEMCGTKTVLSGMDEINELFKELGLPRTDGMVSDRNALQENNEDFYSKHEYEKAKARYLLSFESIGSRNNLAYMLRRKEISSVYYEGKKYTVPDLLKEGVECGEPYSLLNYALYISEKDDIFLYSEGLNFLKKNAKGTSLLNAAMWWYDLKKNNEFEGFIVSMWLCDLNLSLFDSKEDLMAKCNILFPNIIVQ